MPRIFLPAVTPNNNALLERNPQQQQLQKAQEGSAFDLDDNNFDEQDCGNNNNSSPSSSTDSANETSSPDLLHPKNVGFNHACQRQQQQQQQQRRPQREVGLGGANEQDSSGAIRSSNSFSGSTSNRISASTSGSSSSATPSERRAETGRLVTAKRPRYGPVPSTGVETNNTTASGRGIGGPLTQAVAAVDPATRGVLSSQPSPKSHFRGAGRSSMHSDARPPETVAAVLTAELACGVVRNGSGGTISKEGADGGGGGGGGGGGEGGGGDSRWQRQQQRPSNDESKEGEEKEEGREDGKEKEEKEPFAVVFMTQALGLTLAAAEDGSIVVCETTTDSHNNSAAASGGGGGGGRGGSVAAAAAAAAVAAGVAKPPNFSKIRIGDRLVSLGGTSAAGLSMSEVQWMVVRGSRPLEMLFRHVVVSSAGTAAGVATGAGAGVIAGAAPSASSTRRPLGGLEQPSRDCLLDIISDIATQEDSLPESHQLPRASEHRPQGESVVACFRSGAQPAAVAVAVGTRRGSEETAGGGGGIGGGGGGRGDGGGGARGTREMASGVLPARHEWRSTSPTMMLATPTRTPGGSSIRDSHNQLASPPPFASPASSLSPTSTASTEKDAPPSWYKTATPTPTPPEWRSSSDRNSNRQPLSPSAAQVKQGEVTALSGGRFVSNGTNRGINSGNCADATGGDAPGSREPDQQEGAGTHEDSRARPSLGPGEESGAKVAAQGELVWGSQAAVAAATAAVVESTTSTTSAASAVTASAAAAVAAADIARPASTGHLRAEGIQGANGGGVGLGLDGGGGGSGSHTGGSTPTRSKSGSTVGSSVEGETSCTAAALDTLAAVPPGAPAAPAAPGQLNREKQLSDSSGIKNSAGKGAKASSISTAGGRKQVGAAAASAAVATSQVRVAAPATSAEVTHILAKLGSRGVSELTLYKNLSFGELVILCRFVGVDVSKRLQKATMAERLNRVYAHEGALVHELRNVAAGAPARAAPVVPRQPPPQPELQPQPHPQPQPPPPPSGRKRGRGGKGSRRSDPCPSLPLEPATIFASLGQGSPFDSQTQHPINNEAVEDTPDTYIQEASFEPPSMLLPARSPSLISSLVRPPDYPQSGASLPRSIGRTTTATSSAVRPRVGESPLSRMDLVAGEGLEGRGRGGSIRGRRTTGPPPPPPTVVTSTAEEGDPWLRPLATVAAAPPSLPPPHAAAPPLAALVPPPPPPPPAASTSAAAAAAAAMTATITPWQTAVRQEEGSGDWEDEDGDDCWADWDHCEHAPVRAGGKNRRGGGGSHRDGGGGGGDNGGGGVGGGGVDGDDEASWWQGESDGDWSPCSSPTAAPPSPARSLGARVGVGSTRNRDIGGEASHIRRNPLLPASSARGNSSSMSSALNRALAALPGLVSRSVRSVGTQTHPV